MVLTAITLKNQQHDFRTSCELNTETGQVMVTTCSEADTYGNAFREGQHVIESVPNSRKDNTDSVNDQTDLSGKFYAAGFTVL